MGTTTSEAITTSSAQSSSSTNNEETDSSVTATSLYGTNLTRTTVVDDDGNTMSHPASMAVAVTEKNGVKSGDRTREDGYRERYIGKVDIKETKKVTESKENVTNHTTTITPSSANTTEITKTVEIKNVSRRVEITEVINTTPELDLIDFLPHYSSVKVDEQYTLFTKCG